MKFAATLAMLIAITSAQDEAVERDESVQEIIDTYKENAIPCGEGCEVTNGEETTCGAVFIDGETIPGCQFTKVCNTKTPIEETDPAIDIEITCGSARLFATAAAAFAAAVYAM